MFFEEKAKKEGSMLPDETASPRKIQNVSEIASVQEKTATKKESNTTVEIIYILTNYCFSR